MTRSSRKVFSAVHTAIAFIIVSPLFSFPLARASNALFLQPRYSPQLAAEQTKEEKKAAEELEKKALALVGALAPEAMSLKLVENRIYILTGAAEALWKYDEARARALIREAMNQVVESARESREKAAREEGKYFDPRYARQHDDSYARSAVMNFLATRDAKMALEFLQTMRSLRQAERQNTAEEQQEKTLELQLASQIAENDPHTALRIAEAHLDGQLDPQVVNIWNALLRKDPKAASSLTSRIIGSLKSEDILADYNALSVVSQVLSHLKSLEYEIANAENNPDATNALKINAAEIRQAHREALEALITATLRITASNLINPQEADKARSLLSQITIYLPDIEKLLPSRIAAVRAKVAQFDLAKYASPHDKFYAEYGNDLHNKPVQDILALAARAPQEIRPGIYYQAIQKAMGEGDDATARKIVRERISEPWQANNLMSEIERRKSDRAIVEGKFADARKSLATMRTEEQRASALAGWAMAAMNKGDQKSAREMLQEARALIGSRMLRNDQLETQVTIASAGVTIDPDISFEIAEAAIERLNRLVAANIELQTFGGMEEGETRILTGGVWGGYSGNIVQLLASLARKDFDRTCNLLKRWQSNEIRLMISLSLAQSILSGHGVGEGGGVGIGATGEYYRRSFIRISR